MQSVKVNGVELEYEVSGTGEPVLLISPVIADGFLPLLSQPALADRYQLIRYHRRGWVGSTHTPPPVSVADHAADAAALLDHLGLRPVHIAGHSSGAPVAVQLALDHPEHVHTLVLLEPALIAVPSLEAFLTQVEPAFEAYASGDHADALAMFLGAVSGLEWTRGRPCSRSGFPARWRRRSGTPTPSSASSCPRWPSGPSAPNRRPGSRPVLSVVGSETQPMWVEVAELLRSALPQVDECTIDGVGHLLQIQRPEPVARGMAEFLGRHLMSGDGLER